MQRSTLRWARPGLLCLAVVLCGCGSEAEEPILLNTNAQGWPEPAGGWSAIYRASVEMESKDFFRERDKQIAGKGTLYVEQRETMVYGERQEVEILRGLVGHTLERERRGKLRKGSLGDLVGIGRRDETPDTLKSWFMAPGAVKRVAWKPGNGAAPSLVLSMVPKPDEPPTQGLRWDHDTVFLPSLERDTVLRATSTLTEMGKKTWTIESVITSGDEALVQGKRTLIVSAYDGSVQSGDFEGLIRIPGARMRTVRIQGRIERVEAMKPPAEAARVETALLEMAYDDPKVRVAAAKTIGALFPHGGRGAHVLAAAALDDEDADVRSAAAGALRTLAEQSVKPVVHLLTEFGARGRDDLLTTVRLISSMGSQVTTADVAGAVRAAPKGGALAMALTPFDHHDARKRHVHGDVCEVLSSRASPLVKAGVRLRDPDDVEFAAMAMALHAVGNLPPSRLREGLPELLALLENEDPSVAWIAVRMLDLLGARGTETMIALRKVAERPKQPIRAARAMMHKDTPTQPDEIATLVKELTAKLPPGEGKVEREHLRIIDQLADLGADAKAALPDIQRVFNMVTRGKGRPSVRTLIVAEALCRIHRPTAKRIGLFTTTLQAPPSQANKDDLRVYVARAQRAASALAQLLPDIRPEKWRTQIGTRAMEGLFAYQDARVAASLLGLIEALGRDARFAAKPLASALQQVEKDWQQTLALDSGARGDPDRADRASLLLEYGNDFSRELVMRHGLVRAFRTIGSEKTLPVLEWLIDTTDPLLRYEVARTLRTIKPKR